MSEVPLYGSKGAHPHVDEILRMTDVRAPERRPHQVHRNAAREGFVALRRRNRGVNRLVSRCGA